MKRRKLLVADTNQVSIDMIKLLTEETHQLVTASDLTQTLACLRQEAGNVDAILVDTALPDMERCRMIRKIKQLAQFSEIPIIALSCTPSDIEEAAVLRYGASDYVRKPFCPDVFLRRLQNLTAPSYRTRLFYPQELDPHTGVLVREAFCVKAERLIREEPDTMHQIVCARINNLTQLRKRHSDLQIGRLYQAIAKILADKICTGRGALGRYDGERFAMCLPFHEQQLRANIAAAREELSFYPIEPEAQLQFGICTVHDPTLPVEELCAQAIAVTGTPGSIHSFCISCDELNRQEEARRFAEDLNRSILERRFELRLQPCHDLTDARICAALVSCVRTHPHDGEQSISALADLAGGSLLQLDMRYLSLVSALISEEDAVNGDAPCLLLSLCVQTLMLPNCTALLKEKLCISGASPSRYALIVSADDYTEHFAYIEHTVSALRTAGFRVILDKLSPLHAEQDAFTRFHADAILFDAARFRQTNDFHARAATLNVLVRGAKHMQIPLLAVNITTREELAFVRSIGCTVGTGLYFSEPLRTDLFADRLAQGAPDSASRICNPLLTQPDVWDPASLFNIWFDASAGAMLLIEIRKEIAALLRANDSFFTRFHTERTAFALCAQTFTSFLLPSDADAVLQACHSALNSECEQTVQFSMRTPGGDSYHPVDAAVRAVFRSPLSFVVLMSLSETRSAAEMQKPIRRKAAEQDESPYLLDLLAMCSDSAGT